MPWNIPRENNMGSLWREKPIKPPPPPSTKYQVLATYDILYNSNIKPLNPRPQYISSMSTSFPTPKGGEEDRYRNRNSRKETRVLHYFLATEIWKEQGKSQLHPHCNTDGPLLTAIIWWWNPTTALLIDKINRHPDTFRLPHWPY